MLLGVVGAPRGAIPTLTEAFESITTYLFSYTKSEYKYGFNLVCLNVNIIKSIWGQRVQDVNNLNFGANDAPFYLFPAT